MFIIGSLSNGVFERRTSTGSEVFFILKHLDAPKFVFLSVLTIIETSCPKKWAKPLSKNEKKPLPVDVRRSKTSLQFTNIPTGGYTNFDTLLVSYTNTNTRTCQKLTFIIANTVIGNTVVIANSIHILYAVLFYSEKYNNFKQFRFRS